MLVALERALLRFVFKLFYALKKISGFIYTLCIYLDLKFIFNIQSERSDDKFCDDIFGETPTGVQTSVSVLLKMNFK